MQHAHIPQNIFAASSGFVACARKACAAFLSPPPVVAVIVAAAAFSICGCTHIAVDFSAKSATVTRFATDAALESAEYTSPDGTVVKIGGYSSTSRVDAIIKLLEAAK